MITTVYHNGKATTLRVSGKRDIEELIARCGWTITNEDQSEITGYDRQEIELIRAQGYAESMGLQGEKALEWWHEHTIKVVEGVLTPDM